MIYQAATLSRRHFMGGLAASALILGADRFSTAASAIAEEHTLDFRLGAAPLLLHFNENSLGMSPKAAQAAAQGIQTSGNRYADDLIDTLFDRLAQQTALPRPQIMLGNGSTDIIRAAVIWASENGATLLEPDTTFGDARRYAKALNVPNITVPLGRHFQTDLNAMRSASKKVNGPLLINICTPNNPTGAIVNSANLKEWIRTAPENHLFLIDEAYHDYAVGVPGYETLIPLVAEGQERVLIARTFSKVYGMAGMRVGYGVAGPNTAQALKAYTNSYNLNVGGVGAALVSLEDTEFYNRSLASNIAAKNMLLNALETLELDYVPSATNFVLHRINSDLESYQKRMALNNIRVGRRMTREDGWNRISLGTADEMQAFVHTLHAFREKGWA